MGITSTQRDQTEKMSKQFGLRTRYLRAIVSAKLLEGTAINTPTCCPAGYSVSQAVPSFARSLSSQSTTTQLTDEQTILLSQVSHQDVYAVRGQKHLDLLTWLSAENFEVLRDPSADAMLRCWLDRLEVPQEEDDPQEE